MQSGVQVPSPIILFLEESGYSTYMYSSSSIVLAKWKCFMYIRFAILKQKIEKIQNLENSSLMPNFLKHQCKLLETSMFLNPQIHGQQQTHNLQQKLGHLCERWITAITFGRFHKITLKSVFTSQTVNLVNEVTSIKQLLDIKVSIFIPHFIRF